MKSTTLIKLSISIILIGILIWNVNFNDIYISIKDVNLILLMLAFSLCVPGIFISTFKWELLLKAQGIFKPNFVKLFSLYFIGMFFSNFMPTEFGGDLYRSYCVGKTNNKQTESLAATSLERATGFIAVIFYALLGLLLNWTLAEKLHLNYIVFGTLAVVFVSLIFLYNRRLAKSIKRILNVGLIQKLIEKLQSFYEAIYLYKSKKGVIVQAMGLSVIFQILTVVYVYILADSLNMNSSILQLILIVPMITLIGVVPITVNGLGLREGTFVYFFTHMGASVSQSFTLAILFRLGLLIPSLVGGLLYMISDMDYKKSKRL